MKEFLEKAKAALQTAWEKIKALIGKLPFNGYAAKVPALAKVAAYANYAVCVVVLAVVIAVIGGVSGGGKKDASGKTVNVFISGLMADSGGTLSSYWKISKGSSEFAVKKDATFTVPEIEGQDGSKITEYIVQIGNDRSQNVTIKAGEKISCKQLQEWADAQVDMFMETANASTLLLGDALSADMKAMIEEQNKKQAEAAREQNILMLTLPDGGDKG